METLWNRKLVLWSLGTLQPATAAQTAEFIGVIFKDVDPPSIREIEEMLKGWVEIGYVMVVSKDGKYLYSLTALGNKPLSSQLRYFRDTSRLFLMKQARKARLVHAGEFYKELAGGAPAGDGSIHVQDDQWPINLAAAHIGQIYWPLIAKQLRFEAGPDSDSPALSFYSFSDINEVHSASSSPAEGNDLSLHDFAVCMGVSPRLISSILHDINKQYRSYEIGKRGGGTRLISSPRTFLKVFQWWILDYLLWKLPTHHSCHSYQRGKSIRSNAESHTRKRYVANLDITDFFGSIGTMQIFSMLIQYDFGERAADIISKLTSLNGMLPQGAPTSPVLSNSYLYDFDDSLFTYCENKGLSYTRYADDMTISGDREEDIISAIKQAKIKLRRAGLKINDKKSRIANRGGQQRVTGLVVNECALPPRKLRREIRAMFHNAQKEPEAYKDKHAELVGYLGYMQSFPEIRASTEIQSFAEILRTLK